ncbi:hypothetical protein C1646_665093 [Rhizophagus diaphanus]|nr:hypothetical protein C1646_665093 [Rhizophagus diaphanus] [Rhizophagus sp. MUCL 43196]
MGVLPSREKFIALEGYVQKNSEERQQIITNAEIELIQQDKDLAIFLGAKDAYLGCFIRVIIMICIDENNAARNEEFNKYLEEYKNYTNEILQQRHTEMNEQMRHMSETWKLREEYYFKNTTIPRHQIQIELGTIDIEDKIRIEEEMMNKHNSSKKQTRYTLDSKETSLSEDEQLWENCSTLSDTSGDEQDINKQMKIRYNNFNKASQPRTFNTTQNTNYNSQMQEENGKGNFGKSRHQSIMMAYTSDHDMGENSLKNKESMHKPKSTEDLKYLTGTFTNLIKGNQMDQLIIEFINNNKLLEYHVNTLGKITRNGNKYTYVGFFTETVKNNFIKDGIVKETLGNIKELEWLNKMNKMLTILVTGIDKSKVDINDVNDELEKKIGKILSVKNRTNQGGKVNMKLVMNIQCTEEELINTWGLFINGRIIK